MKEKSDLRKEMRALRRERSASSPAQAFLRADWSGADTFFVYRSFRDEADTRELIAILKAMGKRVFSPRVEGREMVAVEDKGRYALSRFGIEEPIGEAYPGDFDVTVLPLLAVDEAGHRLGYGGGYYDRFLRGKETLKVGYCYEFQVLDKVPFEDCDVSVDMICTERGLRAAKRG